jgi:hypothetical protein
MADLAACYFCGAALDDSLSTVSLGDGPDAPTLTLCTGCKEKLETVLASVDTGSREPDATGSIGAPDPDPAPATSTDPSSAERTEQREMDASSEAAASTPDAPEPTTADAAGEPDPAGPAGNESAETPESNATEAAESDAPDAAANEAPDGGESDDADGADDGRSIVEGDQEISALEYNKVMRLLQNREFPVDREEIVTVAANAYQVARADCDRVIEAAIDRGILEEADGQLVKPD